MPTKTDQGRQVPAGLEYKAALASPESGLIEADDTTGVVEAIVSVTGVLDEDRDVIKPGSYAKTLAKRRPKGIFVHDWSKWVARTEEIAELMPGDHRLPKRTKDGRPWPAEAGGLYVKARFNLDTPEGKAAYSNVKFFSETGECEWSIGYKVPPGKSARTKSGERHIEEVDLFEYSPVLFGAAPLSGTLSVKTAAVQEGAGTDAPEGPQDAPEGAGGVPEDAGDAQGDDAAFREALAAAEADLAARLLEALEELDELVALEDVEGEESEEKSVGVDSTARSGTDLTEGVRSFTNAFDQVIRIRLTKNGKYRVEVDNQIAVGPNDREDLTADEVEGVLAKYAATDMLLPVQPKVGDLVSFRGANGRVERVDSHERSGHTATISFPGSETRTVPVASLTRPRKLSKGGGDDIELKKMGTGLDRSPGENWVEKTGRLPAYIEEIAKSIHEKRGMPLEQAIPIAIAQVKRWASGGGDVEADTRAKAVKAVAEWEALKAKNRARQSKDLDAESEVMTSSTYPFLPGTYEELREEVRQQAVKVLGSLSANLAHVEVMGTWPGSAVVTAYHCDGKTLSYEIPYSITIGDEDFPEVVELDEPVPVELKVSVDGVEEDAENLLPYPSILEDVTVDLKALLGASETKAGRVLSAVNEKRLLAAVESLVAVLKAAGLEVDATERVKEGEEEERNAREAYQYQDTTAPSARVDGKMLLSPELLARGYRLIGDAYAR